MGEKDDFFPGASAAEEILVVCFSYTTFGA